MKIKFENLSFKFWKEYMEILDLCLISLILSSDKIQYNLLHSTGLQNH